MPTRTAAEQREEARVAYDAWLSECPGRLVLDRIGDKWTALLLRALTEEPQRYSDLLRRLAGISQKMLTQALRGLERDGLLTRQVTPSVPVRVDYELTELGRSLLPVVDVVSAWASEHIEEIKVARGQYDDESAQLRSA